MTVPVQTPYSYSVANGLTTVFPYSFKIAAVEDLVVTIDDVIQTSGYSVSGVGNSTGGNITFSTPPSSGMIVGRYADPVIKRDTDYQQFGDWNASIVNLDFDRIWLALRSSFNWITRSLKFPLSDGAVNAMLPSRDNRKGRLLAFHETTGDPAQGPLITSIDTVTANVGAIDTVAASIGDVNAVADSIANVNAVADNEANVNTVSASINDVVAVGQNIAAVAAVAGNEANIDAVAGNASNINTVSSDIGNVNAVGTNIASVNSAAANMAAIFDAPARAVEASIAAQTAQTAQSGAEAARDAALLSRGVFSSTSAALSKGVAAVAALVGGSGGTNGTFDLSFSDGGGSGASGRFVVAGGAVVGVSITASGSGYTSAPTISFAASVGLSGASASAVIANNVDVGEFFSVPTVDSLIVYKVDSIGTATEIYRYPSVSTFKSVENSIRVEVEQPNLFTSRQLAFSELPLVVGGTITATTIGGLKACKVTSETVFGSARIYWRFPISLFQSGRVSGQVTIPTATAGTSGTIRIVQRDALGSQVASSNIATGITNAISSETTFSLSGATLLSTATTVDLDINLSNSSGDKTREFYVRAMLLCDGDVAVFRHPQQQPDYRTVYVATTGSDLNAGTLVEPFATLAKAVAAVSPNGRIIMREGDYSVGASLSGCSKIEIGAYKGERVRFVLGNKISGISKSAGYTKVYQAALAVKPALWVWEHEIPDIRTQINLNRHPLQRGRLYRLQSTYISEVSSIAEIDSTTSPSWFWDAGVLYFSASDSADATTRSYYVPAGNGAIYGGTGVEDVRLENISVLYSGLRGFDARNFNRFEAINCAAMFGQSNGFAMDDCRFISTRLCESAGNRGDGFNTHRYASNTHHENICYISVDAWAHDNYDDGDSMHEDCIGTYYGGLYEYNGDRGIATAYGAHAVAYGSVARYNGQADPTGGEGFCAIGAVVPVDDNGVGTQMDCIGCQSYGNRYNYSTGANDATMTIVDSKSWDANITQYAAQAGAIKLIDCTFSGSGSVKSGNVTVSNTSVVL